MQFGFGDRGAHMYLPHMFTPDSVVYTGTHDNNTTLGWWETDANAEEKSWAADYLGNTEYGIPWAFIRAAFSSVSTLAVVPMQDVLGLNGDARMNIPSQPGGNWSWRLRRDALTSDLAARLASLTEITDRDSCVKIPKASGPAAEGTEFAA
jgi:4-alpha-glucanotransferase